MASSILEIPQLISRCLLRPYSRSGRDGHTKAGRASQLFGLMVMVVAVSKPSLAQMVAVNGPIVLPATNVASSSAPQSVLLKTTSAETLSGFSVPLSEGGKQEYTVGTVSGCAVDGVTSNPTGTVCTVQITFSPAYPGQRQVPLQVVTSAGKVNIGLNGTGMSPLAVLTPGTMSTLAGEINAPNCNAYSGPALQGPLCNPSAGAVDFAGNVYVAAFYSNTVSKIDTSGNITVIAGTGAGGLSGVGGPATSATFDRPSDVIVDPAGNVYFGVETAQQILRIDAVTHILTSVAGNGTEGYSGDGGPATQASLNRPEGLALDAQGNLYIEDQDNNLIRKVDTSGIITTVAGNPATIGQGSPTYSGDGGPATQANLALCCSGVYASYDSITVDPSGNLFIGDSGHHVVREVTTDGIIHTVAGNNALGPGYSGDGGAATSAQLNWPMGVAVDPAGDLYIADFSNNLIRRVDAATQNITTVAGNGTTGSSSSGPATQVSLNGPQKVALDGPGNLYVADTKNNLVRKSDVSNLTLTFATPTPVGSIDTTDGPLEAFISNIGNAPLMLPPPSSGSNPSISTGFTGFIGNSGPCPIEGPLSPSAGTLAQGNSCGISVEFDPVSMGSITGSIVLTDNSLNAASPYSTQTISLAGTAIAAVNTGSLTIAPTAQTFASTAVGSTSAALTSTITNTTNQAIYLSSGSLTDATDFTQTSNCSIISANGGTCTVTFTFTPQTTGALTSTYSIHDLNHPNAPLTVVLSGNGTAAPAPQPVLTPATLNFGNVTIGTTSSAQTATLKNTGTAALSVVGFNFLGSNPGGFSETNNCGNSLAAGASCSISVVCEPVIVETLTASLAANFSSPIPQQFVALTCNGTAAAAPQATLSPATADFGNVTTGTTSSAQTFTLSNTGTTSLGITSISLSGANAGSFSIGTDNCATGSEANARPARSLVAARGRVSPRDIPPLPSEHACLLYIVFSPTTAGTSTATLTIVDDAGTQTSTLTGTGVAAAPPAAPQASLTAASANFNSVTTGSNSAAQTFTLANTGNAALSITSVALTGANASSFQLGADTCGTTLAAGASCTIAVTFDPASTGSFNANLSVTDALGTQTSALSGTGVASSTPADFTITATPAAQSSYRGANVSYTVQLNSADPTNPFTNAVALSATGLPDGSSVSFSPASVVPGTTQAATSSMTVTIPAASAHNSPPAQRHPFGALPAGVSLASFGFAWFFRSKGKRYSLFKILLAFASLACAASALTGCGSTGTGFALPSSTSTIIVTGTSGSIAHSTNVTLTVK
jgi:sugar lactone lactonase YvrE